MSISPNRLVISSMSFGISLDLSSFVSNIFTLVFISEDINVPSIALYQSLKSSYSVISLEF
jgi:hypothetical protein